LHVGLATPAQFQTQANFMSGVTTQVNSFSHLQAAVKRFWLSQQR
jgi:hypothetical protein